MKQFCSWPASTQRGEHSKAALTLCSHLSVSVKLITLSYSSSFIPLTRTHLLTTTAKNVKMLACSDTEISAVS